MVARLTRSAVRRYRGRMEGRMICTCSPDGTAAAEAARVRACVALGVQPERLCEAVVASLAGHHGAEVDVSLDMWFGVSVTARDGRGLYVECDWPLDGMIWAWDRIGPVPTTPLPPDQAAAVALASALRVAALRIARAVYEHHAGTPRERGECAECCLFNDGYRRCLEGGRLSRVVADASRAACDLWTFPDSDACPAWWGLDLPADP